MGVVAQDLVCLEAAEETVRCKARERFNLLRKATRVQAKRHWAREVGRRNVRGGRRADDLTPYNPDNTPAGEQIAWYRETATDDGAGNVNPWTDKWTGNDQAQGTQANRPNIIASDSNFNGQKVYEWNGTSDVTLSPTATEPNFVAMNNGTGFLLWLTFRTTGTGTQYLLGTHSSSVQTGFRMTYDGTAQRIFFAIANGTTDILSLQLPDGTVPINTQIRLVLWIKDGLAPGNEVEVYVNDVLRLVATVTGTFPVGNPTNRLTLGRLPSGSSQFFVGRMAELGIITNVTVALAVALYQKKRYSP